MVVAIDDMSVVNVMRLFNEPAGQEYLRSKGVPAEIVSQLHLLGFSGIANMLSAIKMAKYYEMTENDVVVVIFTDSMELYATRIEEYRKDFGPFTASDAAEALPAICSARAPTT